MNLSKNFNLYPLTEFETPPKNSIPTPVKCNELAVKYASKYKVTMFHGVLWDYSSFPLIRHLLDR